MVFSGLSLEVGLVIIVHKLHRLETYVLKAMRPCFRLACDSKLVLARLKWPYMTDPQEPHADLLSATQTLIQNSEVRVELYHIKGHQDSSQFGPFTWDATLNIKANQIARTKLTLYMPALPNLHIPWSQGVCYMGYHQVEIFLAEPYATISMAKPWKLTGKNNTKCC